MADQAQAGKLQVRLVTPDRELVNIPADAVELPGRSGYLEVLYGAAPLLTELGTGLVTIHGAGNGNGRYYVAWGFAEVLPNRVTILAESANTSVAKKCGTRPARTPNSTSGPTN